MSLLSWSYADVAGVDLVVTIDCTSKFTGPEK